MDELRGRALEIIKGQARIERVVKRYRVWCTAMVVVGFSVGFVVGCAMPFQIRVVQIADASHR